MATVVGKSTKTSTSTKNGVKTTIIETTLTKSDGYKEVIREETTEGAPTKTTKTVVKDATRASSSAIQRPAPSKQPQKRVDIKDFRQQALARHNKLRERHGSGPLTLSSELNDYAQQYAETLAKTGEIKHSDCMLNGERIGENLADKWATRGADFTGDEPCDMWYDEIKMYDFSGDRQKGTGHFTQLVWKGTNELGMGKAHDSKGMVIAVGSYRPPGNCISKFKDNVLPPKK